MALHRDIYWVGRQWAVTGFGVQAVDQRLKGAFDIERARLWEDNLEQRMRALPWLKADDFDKALDIARARFPEPPRKSLSLVDSILEMIPPAGRGEAPKPATPPIETTPPASVPPKPAAASIGASLPPAVPPKPPAAAKTPPLEPLRTLASSIERSVPPHPPAAPLPASAPASRPTTRLGTLAARPQAAPPPPLASTGVTASRPAAIEQPPAKFQPLALRIEHASAKFLPRWRVRQ
jgi:hypothetical protein